MIKIMYHNTAFFDLLVEMSFFSLCVSVLPECCWFPFSFPSLEISWNNADTIYDDGFGNRYEVEIYKGSQTYLTFHMPLTSSCENPATG